MHGLYEGGEPYVIGSESQVKSEKSQGKDK